MDETSYRYTGDRPVDLTQWATQTTVRIDRAERDADLATLQDLQRRLYAQKQMGVIIVLQGMDTAGKDGLIRHVFSGFNAAGTSVVSFKQPTSVDLQHDFLWRVNQSLPARGEIRIFNRSQYEDVLISRVHPEILVGQHLPGIQTVGDVTDKFFNRRYHDLRHYETYLAHQGFMMYKFFLHISQAEQTHRLERRLARPEKNWKFSTSDLKERQYWDDYQTAYAQMLAHTATPKHPWYIIPADDKSTARRIVSAILAQQLGGLDPQYPQVSAAEQAKFKTLLHQLRKGRI